MKATAQAACTAVAVTMVLVLLGASPAGATDDVLDVTASIDGRDVDGAGSSDPVIIDPSGMQQIDLAVTNASSESVNIRRVRLRGDLGGLTLVAYDIGVDLEVSGGETESLSLPVEFIGLERQARGLLPGGLSFFDDDRNEIGAQDFVIDVKGDTTSVMGLFAIFVTVATAVALGVLGTRTARRTLVGNRARRAFQFALAGLGLGGTLVLTLAVLRVAAPTASIWIPLLVIPTAAAAIIGYTSPGPLDFEPDDIDEATAAEREPAPAG